MYRNLFSYTAYEQFLDHDRTLSGILAYYPLRLTVEVEGQPEPAINGQLVSGNYYQVLGVNAALGRTIAPEDDRAPVDGDPLAMLNDRTIAPEDDRGPGTHPVCVISHGYWRRRFGGDPAIIGKTIHLSGYPFTIIGVTPPEFFGAVVSNAMDISAPLTRQQQVMPGSRSFEIGR